MKKILLLFIIFTTLAFAGSDDIKKSGFLKKPISTKVDKLVIFNFLEYLITSIFILLT